MAPKAKKPDTPKTTAGGTSANSKTKIPPPPEPKTIGEKLQQDYVASRPYQTLKENKGWSNLTPTEKTACTNELILEFESYLAWSPAQQKEFEKLCETLKIARPLPKPRPLGQDRTGKKIEDYSIAEYKAYQEREVEIESLKRQSDTFKRRRREQPEWVAEAKREEDRKARRKDKPWLHKLSKEDQLEVKARAEDVKYQEFQKRLQEDRLRPISEADIQEERERRRKIAEMVGGKRPGQYEGDPLWDDIAPMPQDDGEKPLAAIAYTDEYAEAISYLRAVMAIQEHTPRALKLTAHIIDLNPAHYTVWLYRASILKKLNSDLYEELNWVNEVALANQKNYQIWHHRQFLIDTLFPSLPDRAAVLAFARSETDFMTQMFELDSKNYHVWSYRQYLVQKLDIFPSQIVAGESGVSELSEVEFLLRQDVRNNSAWSHRFFIVFSDPGHSTPGSGAVEHDPKVPDEIIEREIEFSKKQTRRAPQNQSPWNYVRGVLRKGGRQLAPLEAFAGEFVRFEGDGGNGERDGDGDEAKEDVRSSHALDFLADVWAEKGEKQMADRALELLGEKYDRIRRNYWEYRREALREGVPA